MRRTLTILLLLFCLQMAAKAFDVRAVYVDNRTQVQTVSALKDLALKASEGGMNAMIVEWEATFPFTENAVLCNQYAYSRDEVKELIDYCNNIGVDLIPLQNCFGHVEYILRHERYAPLREDKKDFSQVCPLKRDMAAKVFRSIFTEIAEAHPSKYIHIGCDETFLLGHCKDCADYVEKNGKSKLFVEYVSMMCGIVADLGKTPVIWGDILLQNPDAADLLPKDVIVVDWNYGWKTNRFGNIDNLLDKGIKMWGASALRSGPDNIYLTQWDKHFANLRNYIPFCREKGYEGIVQTSWSTSGQYGYIWDYGFLTELQPVREVYPAQAFDILWRAFFEAVAREEPLRDDFEIDYCVEHFSLNRKDAADLAALFSQSQDLVSGSNFSIEKIEEQLGRIRETKSVLRRIRPRRNKKDFAHYVLMVDIRENYLEYKYLECCLETGVLQREDIAKEIRVLLRDSSRLQRRFVRLNKKNLKAPEIPLGRHSYIDRIKELS